MEQKPLQWKWVWTGVAVGAVLISSFIGIVWTVYHNPVIPALIGSLCFIITGIIVGYKSPGVTIREAAAAGVILMVVSLAVMTFGFQVTLSVFMWAFGIVLGLFFALIGAWAGELMQGTLEQSSHQGTSISYAWVALGVIVGFLLNNFSVFVLFAIFHFGVPQILGSLGLSFIVTGFIVGYKSPGIMIKEGTVAGVVLVVVNFFFIYFAFKEFLPMSYLISGLVGGFLLSLVGGWVGEKVQAWAEEGSAA